MTEHLNQPQNRTRLLYGFLGAAGIVIIILLIAISVKGSSRGQKPTNTPISVIAGESDYDIPFTLTEKVLVSTVTPIPDPSSTLETEPTASPVIPPTETLEPSVTASNTPTGPEAGEDA